MTNLYTDAVAYGSPRILYTATCELTRAGTRVLCEVTLTGRFEDEDALIGPGRAIFGYARVGGTIFPTPILKAENNTWSAPETREVTWSFYLDDLIDMNSIELTVRTERTDTSIGAGIHEVTTTVALPPVEAPAVPTVELSTTSSRKEDGVFVQAIDNGMGSGALANHLFQFRETGHSAWIGFAVGTNPTAHFIPKDWGGTETSTYVFRVLLYSTLGMIVTSLPSEVYSCLPALAPPLGIQLEQSVVPSPMTQITVAVGYFSVEDITYLYEYSTDQITWKEYMRSSNAIVTLRPADLFITYQQSLWLRAAVITDDGYQSAYCDPVELRVSVKPPAVSFVAVNPYAELRDTVKVEWFPSTSAECYEVQMQYTSPLRTADSWQTLGYPTNCEFTLALEDFRLEIGGTLSFRVQPQDIEGRVPEGNVWTQSNTLHLVGTEGWCRIQGVWKKFTPYVIINNNWNQVSDISVL